MSKQSKNPTGAPKGKRPRVPIRAKLLGALFVPLLAVVVLSLTQVNQAQDRQQRVEEETALAGVALTPGGLTAALIVEQGDAVVTALGLRDTATFPTAGWEESKAQTDKAVKELKDSVNQAGPVARKIYSNTFASLEENLTTQRAKIDEAAKDPGIQNWGITDSIYPAYTGSIETLFKANDEVARSISDPEMRAAAETLNDANRFNFAVSVVMKVSGTSLASQDPMAKFKVAFALADYNKAMTSLRSRTEGPWAESVGQWTANPAFDNIDNIVSTYLETGDLVMEDLIRENPAVKNVNTAEPGTTQRVAMDTSRALQKMIDQRVSEAKAEARRYQLIGAAVVLGATLAALAVAASILRPMRKLTSQAEEMANVGLPTAVQAVFDTPADQDVKVPDFDPIAVKSRDEVQTVASAINHVQASALDLAVEQATLRRNIADSFVSLGRRTQNLIGLQLELITELEESETDPAVLESLYKLDHLATRARRNAESLVVLGGTEAHRASGTPVALHDVVRATLSEVEAYQRVSLGTLDLAYVPGSAAADLIHLLAELVENGLSFSPPTTNVEVSGTRGPSGYLVTVVDHGVGMTADRLELANTRLLGKESFTVAPSRYLGHYVTGRLAARLGATVSLTAASGGGVMATVSVPSTLLVSEEEATKAIAQAVQAPPAAPAKAGRSNEVHADPDNADVRVDGRPPAVTGQGDAPAAPTEASTESTEPAEPAAAQSEAAPPETTEGGLRKRVPGSHAKAVAERSPLLRSAAVNADRAPLKAETSAQETQNLASLLTAYTDGLDRGKTGTEEPADAQS